jgi:glycosyltransferase involved in cell wall biosynthesis
MPKLSIIILAFNEVQSLKKTVEEIYEVMNCEDIEVIISTSRKATFSCQEMSVSLKEVFPNLRIHFQIQPYVAAAVLEVLETVTSEFVIYMSADKETPASLIPQLLRHMEEHKPDVVSASRWITSGSFIDYGKLKYALSYLAQKLCKLVYFSSLTEFTYGFRIYKTELLKRCLFREPKHPFFLESLLIPLRLSAKIHEIPVKWSPRDEGSSVVSFGTLISYLRPILMARIRSPRTLQKYNVPQIHLGD